MKYRVPRGNGTLCRVLVLNSEKKPQDDENVQLNTFFFFKALPPPPHVFTLRLYENEQEACQHGCYKVQ